MRRFFGKQIKSDISSQKELIRTLSKQRPVIKSCMTADNIKSGVSLRYKQLTDPEYASMLLEKSLSNMKNRK